MLRYTVRRLLWAFAMLIIVSGVVFVLFYVFPSADPAQLRAGRQANADQIQAIRESLGRALFMSGRPRPARREFAKAVQLNPADDFAHFALARACERTGQRLRGLAHAKLAVALHPGVEEYERVLRRLST